MQKKIIALAIAAAFSAPAMAEVTVYGVVDAAVINKSVTGKVDTMVAISGGLSGSRLGVTAVEDVAYGMKAVVKVEYALDTQASAGSTEDSTATAMSSGSGIGAARQTMIALAGDFGTVATGYLQTTGYDWQVKFDPTAGSAVSPLTAVNSKFLVGSGAGAKRAPHAVAYISPDFGGITVAANYTTNLTDALVQPASGATTGNKTTATLLSATYAAGPLAVGGVYAGTANDNTGYTATSDMAFGASYDLGAAKVFGSYQSSTVDTAGTAGNTDSAISFSAVAPVGSGAVAGSYAMNTIDSTAASDNSTSFTVAYLQGLSKTTTAYAAFHKVSKDGATTTDTTILALGLNKKF